MKKEYINKLKKALRNGSFFSTVALAVNNRWPLRIVRSQNLRYMQIEDTTYRKFKHRYANLVANAPECVHADGAIPKKVWICWLQGMENAPDLVKACYESVKEQLPDWDITVITSENVREYVDLPDYISQKWEKGIIPNTQFTDWLRTALLVKHGGLWLDSTVYCTGNEQAEMIARNSLFAYKMVMSGSGRICCSSWLLASAPEHPVMRLTLDMLNDFWRTENGMPTYFFFHIMLTIASEKYPELWNSFPCYNNVSPHMLVRELNEKFDEDRYQTVCRFSDFHKLNYKMSFRDDEKTFYQVLLENNAVKKEEINA